MFLWKTILKFTRGYLQCWFRIPSISGKFLGIVALFLQLTLSYPSTFSHPPTTNHGPIFSWVSMAISSEMSRISQLLTSEISELVQVEI